MKEVSPMSLSDETGSEYEGMTAREKRNAIRAKLRRENREEEEKVEKIVKKSQNPKSLDEDFAAAEEGDGKVKKRRREDGTKKKNEKKNRKPSDHFYEDASDIGSSQGSSTDSEDEEMPDAGSKAAEARDKKKRVRRERGRGRPKKKGKPNRERPIVDERLDEYEVMRTPPPKKVGCGVAKFKENLSEMWAKCVGTEEITSTAKKLYGEAVQSGLSPTEVATTMAAVARDSNKHGRPVKSQAEKMGRGGDGEGEKKDGAGGVRKESKGKEGDGNGSDNGGCDEDPVEVPVEGEKKGRGGESQKKGRGNGSDNGGCDEDPVEVPVEGEKKGRGGDSQKKGRGGDGESEKKDGAGGVREEAKGKEGAGSGSDNGGSDNDVEEVPVQRIPGDPGKFPEPKTGMSFVKEEDGEGDYEDDEDGGDDGVCGGDGEKKDCAGSGEEKGENRKENVEEGDNVDLDLTKGSDEEGDNCAESGKKSKIVGGLLGIAAAAEKVVEDLANDDQSVTPAKEKAQDIVGDGREEEEDGEDSEREDEGGVKEEKKEEDDVANLLLGNEADHYCESSFPFLGRVQDGPMLHVDPKKLNEESADLETALTEHCDWLEENVHETERRSAVLTFRNHLISFSAQTLMMRMLYDLKDTQIEMLERMEKQEGNGRKSWKKEKLGGNAGAEVLMSTIRDEWVNSGLNDAVVATGSYAAAIKVTFEEIGTSDDAMIAVVCASMLKCNNRCLEGVLEIEKPDKYLEAPFNLLSVLLRRAGFFFSEEMTGRAGFELFKYSDNYSAGKIGPPLGKTCPELMAVASICRQNLNNCISVMQKQMGALPQLCSHRGAEERVWTLKKALPESVSCPLTVAEALGPTYLLNRDLRIGFTGKVTVKLDKGRVKKPITIRLRIVENAVKMAVVLALGTVAAKSFMHRMRRAGPDEKAEIIRGFLERRSGCNTNIYLKLIHGFVLSMLRVVRRSRDGELTKDDAIMFTTYDFSKLDRPNEERECNKFQVISSEQYKLITGEDLNRRKKEPRASSTARGTPSSTPESKDSSKRSVRASDMF